MTENTVRRPDLGKISARFAEFDQLTDDGFDGRDEAFQLALDVPYLIAYVEHLEACLDAVSANAELRAENDAFRRQMQNAALSKARSIRPSAAS